MKWNLYVPLVSCLLTAVCLMVQEKNWIPSPFQLTATNNMELLVHSFTHKGLRAQSPFSLFYFSCRHKVTLMLNISELQNCIYLLTLKTKTLMCFCACVFRLGRRNCFIFALILSCVFGAVICFSESSVVSLPLRLCQGLSLAGVSVSSYITSEYPAPAN